MPFTDDDLRRLKYYLEKCYPEKAGWIDQQKASSMYALIARLEAAEAIAQWAHNDPGLPKELRKTWLNSKEKSIL